MKYFNALTELENEIGRLDEMCKTYSVIVNGVGESSKEDIISSLYFIQGAIQDINLKLSDKFQQLFNIIRNDDGN